MFIKVMALNVHIFYNSVLKGGPGTLETLSGVKMIFITLLTLLPYKYAGKLSKGYVIWNQLTKCRDKMAESNCLP